jgi:hypothetical protein
MRSLYDLKALSGGGFSEPRDNFERVMESVDTFAFFDSAVRNRPTMQTGALLLGDGYTLIPLDDTRERPNSDSDILPQSGSKR